MKNDGKILIVMVTIVLVLLLAACDSSSSEETSAGVDNQSQIKDDSFTPSSEENDLSNSGDTSNLVNHDTNEEVGTSNHVPANDKDSSTNHPTVRLKEKYLKKLDDTTREMEELQRNPEDASTYAMKKVEGDRYDVWDKRLNEVYGVLEEQLTTEEMDELRKEQRNWIKYRAGMAKEASLKYEGGTMEHLEYVTVLANLTEERCYELVEDSMTTDQTTSKWTGF